MSSSSLWAWTWLAEGGWRIRRGGGGFQVMQRVMISAVCRDGEGVALLEGLRPDAQ